MAHEGTSAPPHAPRLDHAHKGGHKIIVGGDGMEVDAGSRRGPADCLVARSAGGTKPAPQLGIARIDEQLFAGFGVLDDEQTGVGKIELASIEQPDGDDLVASGEVEEGALPVRLADEV